MRLPEPEFIERDAVKVTQDLISQYERLTGKTLYPAQVERLLIDLIAYRETLIRIAIQEAAKQNLVEYARYPMLDYLGELVGVTRLPAQPARTTIRFTLTEAQTFDVLVPKGTQVETKDGKHIFKILEDATIPAGSLTVEVSAECETAGAEANGYLPGEVSNLLTLLPYIEKAENITTTMGGSDEETDDRLRQRIKEVPESFSNAGSRGAYRFWAMSAHQDIVDVAVTSPSPGVVNVYPLTKYGNPSAEILELVAQTLNHEKIRPLTDLVQCLSPSRVDFSIVANVTLYNYADSGTVQRTITERLGKYKEEMKSKLGKDIVRSQIIGIVNSIYGVYKTDLMAPQTDIVLNENEWANCTGVTINIVGAVDG